MEVAIHDNDYVSKETFDSTTRYFDQRLDDLKERIEDYKTSTNEQNSKLGVWIGYIAFLFAGMQIGIAILLWLLTQPH